MTSALALEETEAYSVSEYLLEWLSHTRARVRITTYEGYEGLIRIHAIPSLGELPLSSLSPLHLQRLYARLLLPEGCLSSGSVLNLHLVLSQALGQAVRWGLIEHNPARGASPPRPERPEPRVLDPSLAEQILSLLPGTLVESPAAIALATGMRRGEILALRWSDLDSGLTVAQVRRTLHPTQAGLSFSEPKTRRSRRAVALPSMLRPYLNRARSDQQARRTTCPSWKELDLVIDRGDGGPLNPDTLSSRWRKFLLRNKLPHVRFHDLRHAHATFMLLKGVHPKVVSERLGHASVGTTLDIYSHVIPTMQTEAVRAFDELFGAS